MRFVTSLPLSKKLKEAGFPQDTNFFYVIPYGARRSTVAFFTTIYWVSVTGERYTDAFSEVVCAAPMFDEIMRQLPTMIKYDGNIYDLILESREDGIILKYKYAWGNGIVKWASSKVLADAAARIYLWVAKRIKKRR